MSDRRSLGVRPLGVTGDPVRGSLLEAVASGAGWRPLLLLGGLAGAVLGQGVTLLLAPQIATAQGGSTQSVARVLLLWVVGVLLGLPFALRLVLFGRRVLAASSGGALVSVALCLVAGADSRAGLLLAALLAGAGAVLVGASHRALLADLYPPLALTHVLVAFRAVSLAAGALAILLVFPLVDASSLSWQGSLLVLSVLVASLAVLASTLPESAGAGQEARYVSRVLGNGHEPEDAARRAGFGEAIRRLLAIPSMRPLLALLAVLASVGYGLVVFGSYVLTQRAGLTTETSRWVLVLIALVGAGVLLDRGGQVAGLLRRSPAALAGWAAWVTVAAGAAMAVVGFVTWPPLVVAALAVAVAGLSLSLVVVDRLLLLVAPVDLRGVAGALADTYAGLLGVGLGGAVLAGIEGTQGTAWGLGALGIVAAAGGLALRLIGGSVTADLDAAVGSMVESVESSVSRAQGVRPPLLTCRGINFSYGPLQILFDVDFTVDDGEMVALLGTNGAGKSTLLRVISGLGLPSAGTVRVAGADVTYAEPGERVRLGVSQIPGGKAVFGPLSVVDNLRLYGYALGRDRGAVDRGIEEAFSTFPRLAERRNAPSSTMSGGEQQMLALSKALILQPRLLLIDELSLGLAPKVVGELLALVRSINDKGTSVVLVEQSVNVALSLAEHAYFMEKGQVRFDGRTEDLLARPDILRSVFLSGVAAGAKT